MIEGFFNCSIMKRAQDKGLAEIHIHNLRDYTEDKYRRVDDYPFGVDYHIGKALKALRVNLKDYLYLFFI